MARIGFKKAKYNKHNADNTKFAALTGNKVPDFEKVVDEKFTPNYANAELYANDGLAERDDSFIDGDITITIADDRDEFIADILGQTINDGEVVGSEDDIAPEIGYGHIIPKVVNGVHKYKVEFFPRVRFTRHTGDNKTKSAQIEFSTSSVEGKVMRLENVFNGIPEGKWIKYKTFDTLTDAESYLDGLLTPTA